MRTRFWTAVVEVACLIAPTRYIHAQQLAPLTSTSVGSVAGVVKDPSGAVLAGAHIELRSTLGSFHQTQISDHLGHYSLVSVPVGNYEVTVTASGFANQVLSPVTVSPGAELSVNLSLKIAEAAETVRVEGQNASSMAASGSLPDLESCCRARVSPKCTHPFSDK